MNDKLTKIKKYFKNKKLFMDIYLQNYEGFNIYIRIDYIKKLDCYRLSWFDLALTDTKNIEKTLNTEFFPND